MQAVKEKHQLHIIVTVIVGILIACSMILCFGLGQWEFTALKLFEGVTLTFRVDKVSWIFIAILDIAWIAAGVYSFAYMSHEGREERFYLFYILAYIALAGMDFAANLVTMYMCFELVTLTTFPLVLHSQSRESIMASLKYLLYSMCGAYMALFGIFVLYRYCKSISFVPGGSLDLSQVDGNAGIILLGIFFIVIGFGVKGGMLPLHAWLPTAHPVAPSPASAVLSALIVKAGVLGIFRSIYYVAGTEIIRGSWVQKAWMVLSLTTVFMGSLLAFREKILKKRLAYSTVSQVSYILFGFSTLDAVALEGSLLHVICHGIIKCGLFLVAGVFLVECNIKNVDDLKGIGKKMPLLLWSYTFLSLGLIGIPPTGGFISKWYLAIGSLRAEQIGSFSWIGPMILLISALLTAGYLLPITIRGFLPGNSYEAGGSKSEPPAKMLIPIACLALITIVIGLVPNPLLALIREITGILV